MAKKQNLENITARPKEEMEESSLSKDRVGSKDPEISWISPDSIKIERDIRFTLLFIGAGIVIMILLIVQSIWTGAILVAVGLVLFAVASESKPKEVECEIHSEGVVVDGKVYSFDHFKSFYLSNGAIPKICLQSEGFMAGQVEMPLLNADIEKVLAEISSHLPQTADKGEDIVDSVNRWLRF